MTMVDVDFGWWTHYPSRLAWFEGRRALGKESAFTKELGEISQWM